MTHSQLKKTQSFKTTNETLKGICEAWDLGTLKRWEAWTAIIKDKEYYKVKFLAGGKEYTAFL